MYERKGKKEEGRKKLCINLRVRFYSLCMQKHLPVMLMYVCSSLSRWIKSSGELNRGSTPNWSGSPVLCPCSIVWC